MQSGFSDIAKETKTAAAAVVMATKGIMTIGKEMWAAYQELTGKTTATDITPEIVVGLISTCGFGVVSAVITAVVAVIGVASIVFKDDLNIVLLVNGRERALTCTADSLRNGECRTKVMSIDQAPSATLMAYPSGFYLYQKARVAGIALGFFGSTAGVSFQSVDIDETFSFGVDCPNTIVGGNNAIHVYANQDADYAAKNVDQSGAKKDLSINLNGGKCTVAKADNWGNVNYCTCLVTPA